MGVARRLNRVLREGPDAGPPAGERLARIELRHVSVRLGSHWAVRDASLEVQAGQRWLLLGPNGAGKTVLLKLLRGDFWPTPTGREVRRYHLCSGEVLDEPRFASDRIAYLGPERQDRYVRRESTLDVAGVVLTGFDDSDIPLAPATPAQKRRITQVLRQVGLAGWSGRRFLALSYGQRRRVLLARAVVREPDLLLLDEALNGLDAKGRAALLRALRRISSPRTAFVLSSHRTLDAPADLTHVAHISNGRVTLEQIGAASRSPHATPIRAYRRNGKRPRVRGAARPLLRLERAAVYRGERSVIGAFDWSLDEGEHWRLSGANGAGKSTLIALLYGDLWPAYGGVRERRWISADDWKARVGLISPELQATYSMTGCTVEEIVASGLHSSIGLNEFPTPVEKRRVHMELRAWRLEDLKARRARELSYGQLRRVLAARAFIRPRRLFLLDEPFDGLDPDARAMLRARLDAAVAKGATIVIATHHEEDVPPYVRRRLLLRLGRAPNVEA